MKPASFADYARYYDLLYRDKDYPAEARLVDGLLRPAGEPAGALLDVGCGSGAHAREFALLGWRVAGVDLSPTMIEIAKQRTPPAAGIEYFPAAATDFSLGRAFSAVVSLFHVVSYQTGPGEALRMFANVRRHLAPGGRFVFDFWHGPGVLADPPGVRVQRRAATDVRLTRIAEPTHHAEDHTVEVNYELLVEHIASSRLERVCEVHRMRYFFLPEIRDLLRSAGFSLKHSYAGMTGAELHPRAWHGLVVALAG